MTYFEEEDQMYFEPYAYRKDSKWYCKDCLIQACDLNRDTDVAYLIEEIADDTINENTVQYEQFPGEIIPLKGITCSVCDSCLYEGVE